LSVKSLVEKCWYQKVTDEAYAKRSFEWYQDNIQKKFKISAGGPWIQITCLSNYRPRYPQIPWDLQRPQVLIKQLNCYIL
jgi:hypothetical protein